MTAEEGENPERQIVLAYAPAQSRGALAALLALDDALAKLLRTTSELALGQLRLAWWRESLEKLDRAPAPAEPVLQGIERELLSRGVTGASLVPIVHGWEVLVEEEALGADALRRFGAGRGALFAAAGQAMGATDPALADAGQGWALADLARNLDDADEAEAARAIAAPLLDAAAARRWPRNARALGAMAHLARLDLAIPRGEAIPHGAPRRVGRLLWHRLTGR